MSSKRADIPELDGLLADIAGNHGVTVDELRSPRRHRPLPAIRAEFCRKAWALNRHPMTVIAWAIRRDHTSVMYLLGQKKAIPSWDRCALRMAAE